jgi:hypothetical protein
MLRVFIINSIDLARRDVRGAVAIDAARNDSAALAAWTHTHRLRGMSRRAMLPVPERHARGLLLATSPHQQIGGGDHEHRQQGEVIIPPTIGAAILFITSEPVPVPHMISNSPAKMTVTVMSRA